MYKHILIATDGSDLAEKAVAHGTGLAKALGAKATIVTVTEPWRSMATGEAAVAFPQHEYAKAMSSHAKEVLKRAETTAVAAGFTGNVLHISEQYPAEGIVEAARREGCDLIVMASHGRQGLSRMLLGSQASRVMVLSAVPVLICR